MKSSRMAAYLLLGAITAAPAAAESPGHYTIFDVNGAGMEIGQGTFALSMNARSSVTGYYVDSSYFMHGFLRTADGTITTFDAAGPMSETEPLAINGRGTIGGFYLKSNQFDFKAFLLHDGGRITKYAAGGVSSSVYSLNDKGIAVGTYSSSKHRIFGYLRSSGGTITAFQDPKAGKEARDGTFPYAINSAGLITGQYINSRRLGGFIRNAEGTFTNFDAPGAGGFLGTNPSAINRDGTVVGPYSDAVNTYHGFVRDPAGTITTFDAPGAGTGAYQGTTPASIADDGTIVGSYIDTNNVYHGFLRSKDDSIREFDAPRAGTGSGDGTIPVGINKSHVIAGYEVDKNGVSHGFLRAP